MTTTEVKVKFTLEQSLKAQKGKKIIILLFFNLGARWLWVVKATLRLPAALPPGMTWYPLYRRLGGNQSPSGRVGKILTPPGFGPRTDQPAAGRYTDREIPAH